MTQKYRALKEEKKDSSANVIKCPYIYTKVKYLLKFSSNFVAISHCFRESNQVADSLANMGCDQGFNTTYHQLVDLPMKARGAFRLDRIGLPSIRKCVQRG